MSATISLLLGLLVAIVVLATLATRLRLPYAILLVTGGLLLGFMPGLPRVELNPELVLVLFLLIGLQLHGIVATIAGPSLLTLIWQALLISLAVIAVRLAGGAPFPQRDLVIFFTFGVILVTLVGQGLSLGPIIRLLGLERDRSLEQEHALAHLVAARAALSRLDELATEAWVPEDALAHLRAHYAHKLETLSKTIDGEGDGRFDGHAPAQQLRQEVLTAERAAVIGLRDRGRIDDETLRLVERELDLEEQRLH